MIILYNNFIFNTGTEEIPWASLTLGVTFACGYVFVATALSGALLPFRAKALYEASPGSEVHGRRLPARHHRRPARLRDGPDLPVPVRDHAELGLNSELAYYVVGGVLAVSAVWYFVTKQFRRSSGVNVDFAFKEIPPE